MMYNESQQNCPRESYVHRYCDWYPYAVTSLQPNVDPREEGEVW